MKKLLFPFLFLFILASCKNKEEEQYGQKVSTIEFIPKWVIFGVDFSHYQGNVNWDKVSTQTKHPIRFTIFRATMGDDRKDTTFHRNYVIAKQKGFIVGSYHYYDPNEAPMPQVTNYLSTIDSNLRKGDFVPILDIEAEPKSISMDSLKKNLRLWLDVVEKKFGVKPILYTGLHFYKKHLSEFAEYPLWVAAYSSNKRTDSVVCKAEIHQFTDKVKVPGIRGGIDGNDISFWTIPSLLMK